MSKHALRTAEKIGLIAGTAFLITLTGCTTEGPNQRSGYWHRPATRVQAAVVFQDDYDYYPGYEVYYSRNRHEYVYRHNNQWVRRPEPSGISVDVLFSSPSVRVDFHDSPERHHDRVVRTYPRNWAPQAQKHADRKDDKKRDRNDDDRNN